VCVDACFTQKRRKPSQNAERSDQPRRHPDTVFLEDAYVLNVEREVNARRTTSRPRRGRAPPVEQDDSYEDGMQLPISVLNECNDSFLAADEKRQKASTQFFADTGLMALLCRHDRVLWLVNMTSPGEKQHYVLALLQRLFNHLPAPITVGVLYDIGCQLERSCRKWDFLADVIARITFGISVFHAYGHQWPCQIVYHPRKREGFGLSDGEGCERFWSAIKKLIPSLRVSGVR
jgi:hypothetical protein